MRNSEIISSFRLNFVFNSYLNKNSKTTQIVASVYLIRKESISPIGCIVNTAYNSLMEPTLKISIASAEI